MHDRPAPANAVFIGELGLGGEVRPIGGLEHVEELVRALAV